MAQISTHRIFLVGKIGTITREALKQHINKKGMSIYHSGLSKNQVYIA